MTSFTQIRPYQRVTSYSYSVCVNVCMYVCVYGRKYVYMYVCKFVCVYTHYNEMHAVSPL
jgi:hypothetical protein